MLDSNVTLGSNLARTNSGFTREINEPQNRKIVEIT